MAGLVAMAERQRQGQERWLVGLLVSRLGFATMTARSPGRLPRLPVLVAGASPEGTLPDRLDLGRVGLWVRTLAWLVPAGGGWWLLDGGVLALAARVGRVSWADLRDWSCVAKVAVLYSFCVHCQCKCHFPYMREFSGFEFALSSMRWL